MVGFFFFLNAEGPEGPGSISFIIAVDVQFYIKDPMK
jgi:hypothetical protein